MRNKIDDWEKELITKVFDDICRKYKKIQNFTVSTIGDFELLKQEVEALLGEYPKEYTQLDSAKQSNLRKGLGNLQEYHGMLINYKKPIPKFIVQFSTDQERFIKYIKIGKNIYFVVKKTIRTEYQESIFQHYKEKNEKLHLHTHNVNFWDTVRTEYPDSVQNVNIKIYYDEIDISFSVPFGSIVYGPNTRFGCTLSIQPANPIPKLKDP